MTVVLTDPQERTRFLRFAVVGIIGAIVDFGVMNLLVNGFHFFYVIAGTISFILAILSNFTWNRFWTYPDSRSKPILRQLIQFAVVSVAGLAIRIPILTFVEPALLLVLTLIALHIPNFSQKFISQNFTLALAVIIVMFWNFFVNRYWTYNDVMNQEAK